MKQAAYNLVVLHLGHKNKPSCFAAMGNRVQSPDHNRVEEHFLCPVSGILEIKDTLPDSKTRWS